MMRWAVIGVCLVACTRLGDKRARLELDVGKASAGTASVEVTDGLAAVRHLAEGELELWCTAPALELSLVTAGGNWTITARNSLVDGVLVVDGVTIAREPGDRSTVATFHATLDPGRHLLRIAPPDADLPEAFRVAAMADIQTALPTVNDVFETISAVPDARFVISMGDITESTDASEFDLFEHQLETLSIPFYSTLGNHDVRGPPELYFGRYGRASFHFEFKGIAFTFVDSGDAGVDPIVEGWLAQSIDQPHVFLTHFPPIDPVGVRYGSFRSTRDADRLLARLAEGHVDLTLYGHVHTLTAFENAGIPAYISGGGGAEPEQGDGIERHFLTVEFDASITEKPVRDVEVHRVD